MVAVLTLVLGTGAFLPQLETLAANAGLRGNSLTIAIWVGLYVLSTVFLVRRWRSDPEQVALDPLILAVVAWALLSVSWSIDPSLSARRAGALAGTTLIGVFVAGRCDVRFQLRLLCVALLVVAACSLALGLVRPAVDPLHADVSAWRGVFGSESLMAQVLALALPVHLIQVSSSFWRWRTLGALGLIVSVSLLWLSGSVTAIVIAPVAVAALASFYLAPRSPKRAAGLGLALVAGLLVHIALVGNGVAPVDPGGLLEPAGGDGELTDRSDTWALSWEQIKEKPFLGWGHGAFRSGTIVDGSGEIADRSGQAPGYAPNGFVDALLGFGFIGLALVVTAMLVTAGRGWRYLQSGRGWKTAWPLTFLAFLVVANLTEGGLVQQNHYMWLLFVAVAVRLRLDEARRVRSSTV